MKNIILLAPPVAGKGTQSKLLVEKYGLAHISTGDLLRDSLKEETDISQKIKDSMNSGRLVDDEIMIELIKERLSKPDCMDGCILDGYPRTLKQAISLDQLFASLNRKIDYVFYLDVDKEILRKRVLGRLTCPNCKSIYNDQIENMNSSNPGICDKCNHTLIKRQDDTEEVFSVRYNTYINEVEPIIVYYKEHKVFYDIKSFGSAEDVFSKIEEILSFN